jgi:hypothetical protein
MRSPRLILLLALSLLFSQHLPAQTPTQAPGSGSSAAQTPGAAHNESAKTKCTDNGHLRESQRAHGSASRELQGATKDATAQCRDRHLHLQQEPGVARVPLTAEWRSGCELNAPRM